MGYTTFTFFLFTAIVLVLYYIVGRRLQKWVLAAANIAFYAVAGTKYLPYLLTTTLATYFAGLIIGKIYEKADGKLAAAKDLSEKKEIRQKAKKHAKVFLLLSLFVAIALLAVCKYATFAVTNLNTLFAKWNIPQIETFSMVLPLGISFYTFMAISYVLDIYWKRYKYEKNLLLYAVFVSYFPHVTQGPIDRYNEFSDQIRDGVKFSYDNISMGLKLAVWGLFKKLVIADRIGILVNEVIDNWEEYDGIIIVVAFIIYSIQIYADFSGCIDIVRGISEMFGITLRKNFNHPYFSRTMGEFWRRWHISLQEWFKDYIYYPVSASRFVKSIKKFFKNKGLKRVSNLFASCFPVLVVWMITGIWHGAAWQYVAWGMFHAALLIGSQIFEPLFPKLNKLFHIDTENFGWHLIQMLRTFFLCCVGRVFFRAGGLRDALAIFKEIVRDFNISAFFDYDFETFGFTPKVAVFAFISCLVLLLVDVLQEKMLLRKTLAKQNIIFRWVILFVGLFAVILLGVYGPGYDASSFIYEQF